MTLVIGLICVGLIITLAVSYRSLISSTLSNSNFSKLGEEKMFEFSGGQFFIKVVSENDTQQLLMHNRKDNTSIVLNDNGYPHSYRDFVWSADKTKLYFLAENITFGTIAIIYSDITGTDPYALTEVIYTDPDAIISANVVLVRVEGSVLFLIKGENEYSLDSSVGVDAEPKIVSDHQSSFSRSSIESVYAVR